MQTEVLKKFDCWQILCLSDAIFYYFGITTNKVLFTTMPTSSHIGEPYFQTLLQLAGSINKMHNEN